MGTDKFVNIIMLAVCGLALCLLMFAVPQVFSNMVFSNMIYSTTYSYNESSDTAPESYIQYWTGEITGYTSTGWRLKSYYASVRLGYRVLVYEVSQGVLASVGIGQEVVVPVLVRSDGGISSIQERILTSYDLIETAPTPDLDLDSMDSRAHTATELNPMDFMPRE